MLGNIFELAIKTEYKKDPIAASGDFMKKVPIAICALRDG